MKIILAKFRFNIIAAILGAALIIIISGSSGLGAYLNNRFAFGYGAGLGYILQPIVSVNKPLVVSGINAGGRLFKRFENSYLEVEVPPRSTAGYALYDARDLPINSANDVCFGSGSIVGNKAFTIFAVDENDQPISKFQKELSVSITLPGLPVNSSSLGVYYLNTNNQWVFGQQALFNAKNSKVAFKITEAGTFAVINAPGLPRLIETQVRCAGQVLGVKEFSEGAILRTCDAQMYEIEDSFVKSIGRLPLTSQTYQDKPVNDVDYEVVVRYTRPGAEPVMRQKDFGNGDLLRTCDWKIYRIENGNFRYITTLNEIRAKWEGQVINNVDYWQIAKYRDISYSPEQLSVMQRQQVLGAKTYSPGSLVRTSDNKVYIIEVSGVRHIATLPTSINNFAGQPIFEVSSEIFENYKNPINALGSESQVLGVKKYGPGAYLRTRDWRVYMVDFGNMVREVGVLSDPVATAFNGEKVIDIDYSVLAFYTKAEDTTINRPATSGQVLGVKQYADRTLLKTPDNKIYVVYGNKPQHVATLEDLESYAGISIIDISFQELDDIIAGGEEVTSGGQVLGVKKYGAGAILKTPDWKVYRVINGGQVHNIAVIPGYIDYYEGQKVYNIGFDELTQYEVAQ